jgi:hypothetical protein
MRTTPTLSVAFAESVNDERTLVDSVGSVMVTTGAIVSTGFGTGVGVGSGTGVGVGVGVGTGVGVGAGSVVVVGVRRTSPD